MSRPGTPVLALGAFTDGASAPARAGPALEGATQGGRGLDGLEPGPGHCATRPGLALGDAPV